MKHDVLLNSTVACPYPGLRPFEIAEADIFFGRTRCIQELMNRLQSRRLVAVTGPSGCGKSSLLRAGLLPALSRDEVKIAIMRPGAEPIRNLSISIANLDHQKSESNSDEINAIETKLRHGPHGLLKHLSGGVPNSFERIVLLVDQFEELFRFTRTENGEDARAFVDLILTTAKAQDANICVVISMRSDFIGDCLFFTGLPEALNEGQYLVPRLNMDEIRDAVVRPAAVFGATVESALINKLLSEMGTNPDQLPLMQHAMSRIWAYSQLDKASDNQFLTLMHYEAIGGVSNSLSFHADSIYNELNNSQRRVAEVMFRCMSETGEYGRLHRRPTRVEEVMNVSGVITIEDVEFVVQSFSRKGRNLVAVFSFEELHAKSIIDITHEALLRNWVRLRQWAQAEFESSKMFRRIEENALRWVAGSGALLQGPALSSVVEWVALEKPTAAWANRYVDDFDLLMNYVNESQREEAARQEMEERRRVEVMAAAGGRQPRGTKIFISYRRADAEHAAGRIFDRLCDHFGDNEIFYDVDKIPSGTDFPTFIKSTLDECAVLLVLIGNRWLQRDEEGKRRIDDPKDWVRIEIETALSRKINVIPVLISEIEMPNEDDLPQSLKRITNRQYRKLPSDRDFKVHINRLIAAIEDIIGPTKKRRWWPFG